MKRSRIVLMLTISLIMAAGAALLAKNWLQERMAARAETPNTSTVVVAALEIPFAQTVKTEQVRIVELPSAVAPNGSFSHIDAVLGRVATQTIYPGEVLLPERVVEHLGGNALAVVLEKGKRAVSVRVDDVVGVAGFLLPDNRVDVVRTKRLNGLKQVVSDTILTNIKVLAVDQIASPDKGDPVIVRAVTLEVTPHEAELLIKATQEGKVQLTLRNPTDEENTTAKKSSSPSEAKPNAVKSQRPRARTLYTRVTVIRGTQVSKTKVKQ